MTQKGMYGSLSALLQSYCEERDRLVRYVEKLEASIHEPIGRTEREERQCRIRMLYGMLDDLNAAVKGLEQWI